MTGFSPERSALRGIGSSAVVTAHSVAYLALYTAAAPVLSSIWAFEQIGWMGVALFLALSVYLLVGVLDKNPDLKRYFRRRILRIWPLYFAYCVVVFLWLDHDPTTLFYNLTFTATFTHNIFVVQGLAPVNVVWTLQIEEWAYLCLPLVAMLAHRKRVLLGVLLVAASVVYAVGGTHLVASLLGSPALLWQCNYFEPWSWLAAYGVGLLAYEVPLRFRWPRSVAVGALALAMVPLVGVGAVHSLSWPFGLFLILPAVGYGVANPPRFLARWALVAVGECSYALYLFHPLFLQALGLLGVPFAYLGAWVLESVQRGKEMRRRVRLIRAATLTGNSPGLI